MKDNEARDSIARLSDRITDLQRQLEYYESNGTSLGSPFWPWPYGYIPSPIKLTASELIKRFDELYEYLSVERKTTLPQTKLVKRKVP